jgi:ubiquinone biosynthesis accessory factor UbiJ
LRAFLLINNTFCAAVNHLLEAEEWARAKLERHAGKSVLIKVSNLDFRFQIEPPGLISSLVPDPAREHSLTISLPPASLLATVRGEEGALKNVDIHGDAEFAQAVLFLVSNLRWDVEEDLSRLIGDIAAHRLVADARGLLAWERDARSRLAVSAGEYLTTEAEILAAAAPIANFGAEAKRLRDDTARLEQRIAGIVAGKAKGR